ncbi:hypothetical protein J5X84_02315 [Streptosporangiaceae bacterium NEAU-GS5]|nr:hypothetical protein [Streptosporangiaceae bacterium NEAU-GS5]
MRMSLRLAGLILPGPATIAAAYVAGIWPVVLVLGVLLGLALMLAVPVIAFGIHQDEKYGSLGGPAPGWSAAVARRLLNTRVRSVSQHGQQRSPVRQGHR